MWVALLGPLLVHDGENPVTLPRGRQQRALLAALALYAGRPVTAGTLADLVWDGAPPDGAAGTLRSHVSRLRQALGPQAGARLETGSSGYLLRAGADEVDVLRFRGLCRAGLAAAREGAWERAHALLEEAAGLWRGEFLGGTPPESLRQPGRDLDALRLDAEEQLTDAALHLGRHAEAVPRLRSLAARDPLREGVHGQLMLALYLCGRQAEALAAYQRARDVIVAELGVEPGPGLRELQQRVLSGDPSLLPGPGPAPPAGPGQQRVIPRELPPAVPGFTGRDTELGALAAILDEAGDGPPGTVMISAIGGTAGIGKTALALRFAHEVAGRFPDGQLYASLRGFDPAGAPAGPAEVTRRFLEALGVEELQIPADPEAQAGRYRSLLADRKMLIVLDNARDEAQVRPLLPASPGCLVLVTSRSLLPALAAASGARLLMLDVLSHDEAVALLTSRLGRRRAAAEPGAVSEIAALCARLPLALSVAAARAAARPGFPLGGLAAELAGQAGPLAALDTGDPAVSVAAVFSWSYRQLTPPAARMFRLLGVHPGPDISVPAAASLAAVTRDEAGRLLAELAAQCLITEHLPGRYTFHDLLRAYAAARARDTDSRAGRDAAASRVLDHYLHTAQACWITLAPESEQLPLGPPGPGIRPEPPGGHRQALAWFTAEHQVLLSAITQAAEAGAHRHTWQLAIMMSGYLHRRNFRHERVTILASALDAATRLEDVRGQAMSSRRLGNACTDTGDYDTARAHFEHSLALYRRSGDRPGEAMCHQNLAVLATRQRRQADAVAHSEHVVRLAREAGDEYLEAEGLNDAAYYLALLGGYQQAREMCEQSLVIIAKLGDCSFEDNAWDTLGYIEHHLGDYPQALAHLQHALTLSRDQGRRQLEPDVLDHLGDLFRDTGEPEQARQAWQQALAIYSEARHPSAGEVRDKLAAIPER